jgi:asparagine synthase (glutamine-hydrolysing)
MCGIAGIVGPAGNRLLDPVMVRNMVGAMRHRGPDDNGLYESPSQADTSRPQAVLGACRLAILDLSPSGHQPLIDLSTGAVIVFNGEIYNFDQLRENLKKRGVEFRSHSDTEVVLQLFLRHGAAGLLLLEGMFALAIWDPRKPSLFLARDRLGVKPLYLAERRDCLLFASEIRALLASGLVERRFSPKGVDSYLRFGAVREPHTIIEGVTELSAGTWLTWSPRARTSGRYWNLEPAAPATREEAVLGGARQEAVQRVRELFLDGVRLRLTSDVPVVTFLSGGVDSTSVVAGVKTVTGAPPDTIGVTFAEAGYSEAGYMNAVVSHYGCHHHDRRLTGEELLSLVPEALRAMDQPTFDGINTYVVSRAAAEHGFKVALSGIGGDELFGGYQSFRVAPLLARGERWMRGSLTGRLAAGLAGVARGQRGKKLSRWLRNRDVEGDAYDLVREVFSVSERAGLMTVSLEGAGQRLGVRAPSESGFGEISRRELTEYLRNVLLRDTDCFGMACSLEVREPFLHVPLVEQVLDTPDRWKTQGNRNKPLLVDALLDILPRAIRTRPKHGFTLPFDVWLRSKALRDDVERTLTNGAGERAGPLAPLEMTRVWGQFEHRRTSWNRVWALYVLQRWARENSVYE